MSLELVPVTMREAKRFISALHRHNPQLVGAKAVIGAAVQGWIVGVAVVGRPCARHPDDGWTAEITRVGYRRALTYNNKSESGASMRALGWSEMYDVRGHGPTDVA